MFAKNLLPSNREPLLTVILNTEFMVILIKCHNDLQTCIIADN